MSNITNCVINGSTGGGISVSSLRFYLVNSTIESSSASSGGAIYISQIDNSEINIIDSTFNKNSATSGGGAIYCAGWGSSDTQSDYSVNIRGCNFTENSNTATSAALGGGAIYTFRGANIKIYSSTFTRNSANNSEGGVIRFSSDLIVEDCKFYSNSANQGGALCYGNTIFLTVKNSIFENNTAKREGGAIKSRGFDISGSTFINNTAGTDGGAILARSATSSLSNSKLYDNHASGRGGAIFMHYNVTGLSISGDVFNNNSADYGGVIYSDTNGRISVMDSTLTNNSAKQGGASYHAYANFGYTRNEFYDNNATVSGGAIYVLGDGGEVADSQFHTNHAPLGGAIYWAGDNGIVSGSKFYNNTAVNGSSIYWAGNNGVLKNSEFYDSNVNLASVYWNGPTGTISGSTFGDLKGVYISGQSSVTLSSNTQYSSSQIGYAVYNDGIANFDSNKFKNLIYNYGIIPTQTYLVAINNITWLVDADSITAFASVEDDNGNLIKVTDSITIIQNNNMMLPATFNETHYIAAVNNLPIGLSNFTAVGHNSTSLPNLTRKNGAVLRLLMNLTVNQTNYGEKVVITTVLVNTTIDGTIIVDVNGVNYYVNMTNGTAVLTLYNLAPGDYKITSIYMRYNQTLDANVTIDIQLRNSTINITANNITYGETVTINVTATNGTTGYVYLFVDNKMYIVTLKNSTAQVNITNMQGGVYTVYGVYNGDINFNGNTNFTSFKVTKHNATITINATDVLVGQTAIIKVGLPADANGTTYVYVDGVSYEFNKQPITLTVANLTAGNHTVRVVYAGNSKYNEGNNTTVFEVRRNNIIPTLTVKDIKVGDNETITVTVPSKATGMVLLVVNGNRYYTYANNSKAIFVLSDLKYGKYNVTATYLQDDMYYTNSTNATFTVDYVDMDPKIAYSVDDDLNVVVNVTVPVDVNGDIIIEVNGTNYTAPVFKGNFTVPINGLEGGSYPAKLYFANDTKYRAVNKTFTIVLNKIDTHISIISEHIEVGDNATITVVVPRDASGNVTIYINNKTYTEKVVNGTAVFTVSGLAHGNYTVIANYSGDRKYNSDVEDEILIVRKVDPNPYSYINVTDIFVGETATFNITMPSDLTTKINLTVQNKTYVVNITNGFGQINITGLKYGLPVPVHASFLGNEKYLGCERDYTGFSVHRITNYPININATTNSTSANITVIPCNIC